MEWPLGKAQCHTAPIFHFPNVPSNRLLYSFRVACNLLRLDSLKWSALSATFFKSAFSYLASKIDLQAKNWLLVLIHGYCSLLPAYRISWKSNWIIWADKMSWPIIMSYAPKVVDTCKSHSIRPSLKNSGRINVLWHLYVVCSFPPGVVHTVWGSAVFLSRNFLLCLFAIGLPDAPMSNRHFNVIGFAFPKWLFSLTKMMGLRSLNFVFFRGGWPWTISTKLKKS